MRNLKRALSLVMAAAMLVGVMVISAGAVDYADAADIDYNEAVGVMSAIGVLEGDGNIGQKEKATLDGIAGIMHSITRKNRIYTSKSLLWRIYSWAWVAFKPLRRYPLALWRKLNPQPPLSGPAK